MNDAVSLPEGVPLIEISTSNSFLEIAEKIAKYEIDSVIHLAGFKVAGVSVERPLDAYKSNVTGIINLLKAMNLCGIDILVNSSSAAVYGQPRYMTLIPENFEKNPISPYGRSKLMSEEIIEDYANSRKIKEHYTPFRFTNLRYFNVVGSGYLHLFDKSEHNLFPIVFRTLLSQQIPAIYGGDFDTADGTCVRDYVHVQDLAEAHLTALDALRSGKELQPAYNLGSGQGSTVLEVMKEVADISGISFRPVVRDRRPGDPAILVANIEAARENLGWKSSYTLRGMVESGWKAQVHAKLKGL